MKDRLKILVCCCAGGGTSEGYRQSGFDVVGVDILDQPKYPDSMFFIKADAKELLTSKRFIKQFDAIHVSPVCKFYSSITKTAGTHNNWPNDIPIFRDLIQATGLPYVIENVEDAKGYLINPVMICGTMFPELNIVRHRLFETNWPLLLNPFEYKCNHIKRVVKHGRRPDRAKHYAAATGHFSDVPFVQESMGINWLGQKDLSQAIPPKYTRLIGEKLTQYLMMPKEQKDERSVATGDAQ